MSGAFAPRSIIAEHPENRNDTVSAPAAASNLIFLIGLLGVIVIYLPKCAVIIARLVLYCNIFLLQFNIILFIFENCHIFAPKKKASLARMPF